MKTATFEKLPEDKQISILDAAARIFAKKGYFQAGISEICLAADISNGALYKYFENKQSLFVTIAQRTLELLDIAATLIAAGQINIWDRLQRTLEEVEPFTKKYRDYFLVYMELGSPCMDTFASELSDAIEGRSFEFFHRIIEDARAAGDIRNGISTETAAYFLDNHLMLFAFSCVSDHYNRRFHQYFGRNSSPLNTRCKIELTMRSFQQLLG